MDEKFFAWLDGELDPAEAAAMEQRVASDPELARQAEAHRAFAGELRAAFNSVAAAPVPEALAASVWNRGTVTDIVSWREQRAVKALPQWAAIAATLAIGFFAGTLSSGDAGPVRVRDGAVYAAAGLERALDTQLASAAQGDVRIGLTFRDNAGALCRSFSGSAGTGLACRLGEEWQLRGLFAGPEGQAGEYRMAAGADPQLASLIEERIAGEPFDPAQEAQAKARGWR